MKLEDATKAFEARFSRIVHDGMMPDQWSLAVTGEPFVAIVPGGIKEEGALFPLFATSAEIAVASWLEAALRYADGKGSTLYWRERPQQEDQDYLPADLPESWNERRDHFRLKLYMVYSRFLVTDKAPLK